MTGDEKDRVFDVLQAQLNRHEHMIISILSGWDRVFGLEIFVFTGALSLGIAQDRREVLLVLPAAVLAIAMLGFGSLIELASRQGYSRYLEKRIEDEFGIRDLVWARYLGPEMVAKAWTNRYILTSLYAFFIGASCYLSIESAFAVSRLSSWKIPSILLSLITVSFFATAVVEATRAGTLSHRRAGQGPPRS
jgi:hypothetical protein